MKHNISKILCVLFCFSVLFFPGVVTPASADVGVYHDNMVSVLDYAKPNNGSSNQLSYSEGTKNISFSLPKSVAVARLKILVLVTGGSLNSVRVNDRWNATIERLADNLYILTRETFNYTMDQLDLACTFTGSGNITFLDFRIATARTVVTELPASGSAAWEFDDYIGSPGGGFEFEFDEAPYMNTFSKAHESGVNVSFYIYPENWQNYDFVEFLMLSGIGGISQANVIDSSGVWHPIPFTTNSLGGNYSIDGYCFNSIIVDLHAYTYDDLVIQFTIPWYGDQVGGIVIEAVNGIYISDYDYEADVEWNFLQRLYNSISNGFNSIITWFGNVISSIQNTTTNIINSINSGFNSLLEALAPEVDSGFVDDVKDKQEALDQAGSAIDNVHRPSSDSIDINVSGMVPAQGVTNLSVILQPIFGNELIFTILLLSFTMATVSYVFYGKR